MVKRLRHFRKDERGMSLVFVCLGVMSMMTATTLAIDVGMFMTARSQAQNSADAGALAGAVALVFNDFDNRSASGPAVTSSISAAKENDVAWDDVEVGPEDVTFPLSPSGLNNRVGVYVERQSPTVLGSLFGMNSMQSRAYAEAEASPANAARCLLPFTLPDKWQEVNAPPWAIDSFFEKYANNQGQLLSPRDQYRRGTRASGGTGYSSLDYGTLIELKTGGGTKVTPGVYNPWAIPGSTGADDYEDAIAGCKTGTMKTGEHITLEPGNMVGPTSAGIARLINSDIGARWDTSCNCVKDSAYAISPRIRPIPLYDPDKYEDGKQEGRNAEFEMVSFLGVFVVQMQGNSVIARVTPISAETIEDASLTPSSFAMSIRLVK
jgi:Putative Flp pilus-assembly TadE/G-like